MDADDAARPAVGLQIPPPGSVYLGGHNDDIKELQMAIHKGSVISGTMRPEDLIPCFVDVLDEVREELAKPGPTTEDPEALAGRVAEVGRLDDFLGGIERRMAADGYFDSEAAQWDLEELFDRLNDHAPEGCYFGAHPGDGADFGFWECEGDEDCNEEDAADDR